MPKKKHEDIASKFSDEEMQQIQRYGQALGGNPTPFDEEVEAHLAGMEANAKKMRAAQTGGSGELGPTSFAAQSVKQRDALRQQATTGAAQTAVGAQAQQAPVNAPAAPTGPQGTTAPYAAQSGPQPPPSATAGLPGPGEAPPPPEAPGPEGEEQGPPQ